MNSKRLVFTTVIILAMMTVSLFGEAQIQYSKPVFQVDVADPTADKPQCKLWFNDSCWWSLLPGKNGLSLWQRHPTRSEWKQHALDTSALRNITGKTDVWFSNDTAFVVVAGSDGLSVVSLAYERSLKKWNASHVAKLIDDSADIETATIGRDGKNVLWVAADVNNQVLAWSDANQWTVPVVLREKISEDDICTIAFSDLSTFVAWSDQLTDAISVREHKDGEDFKAWSPVLNIDSGSNTADDHLHYTKDTNATIFLATKNSKDSVGYPQLTMRVKFKRGDWKNYPYALRLDTTEPTRPVVVCMADGKIMAGHTVYNKVNRSASTIEFGQIDLNSPGIISSSRIILQPFPYLNSAINNVTVPRERYPANAPAIFLASDKQGRVYEGIIMDVLK